MFSQVPALYAQSAMAMADECQRTTYIVSRYNDVDGRHFLILFAHELESTDEIQSAYQP